jgi:hypothetical protein
VKEIPVREARAKGEPGRRTVKLVGAVRHVLAGRAQGLGQRQLLDLGVGLLRNLEALALAALLGLNLAKRAGAGGNTLRERLDGRGRGLPRALQRIEALAPLVD